MLEHHAAHALPRATAESPTPLARTQQQDYFSSSTGQSTANSELPELLSVGEELLQLQWMPVEILAATASLESSDGARSRRQEPPKLRWSVILLTCKEFFVFINF